MTQVGALRVDFYAGVIALCAVIVFAKFIVHRSRSLPAGTHWRILHWVSVFSAGLAILASLAVLGWVDESSGERVIRGGVLGFALASAIVLAIDYWDAARPKDVPAEPPSVATLRTRAIDASRCAGSAAAAAGRSASDQTSRIAYVEEAGAHSLDCASAILDAEGREVVSPDNLEERTDLVKAAQELRGSAAKAIYVAGQVRNGTSTLREAVGLAQATAQQAENAVRLLNEQL